MNFLRVTSKIFAGFSLFFVSFVSVNAQQKTDVGIYDVPAGTKIRVSMDNEINSKVSVIDDTFTATLDESLIIGDVLVLPPGTVIEGRVLKVQTASFGGRDGRLIVSFETMRLTNGVRRQIEGVLVKDLKARASTIRSFVAIAGATTLGGIIGVVSKARNGALIGLGIGAGAGTGFVLLQKGKDVAIKADEKFEIKLLKDVTLPARDF